MHMHVHQLSCTATCYRQGTDPLTMFQAHTARTELRRGNAMSGAPMRIGTNQLPNPPIMAGINSHV